MKWYQTCLRLIYQEYLGVTNVNSVDQSQAEILPFEYKNDTNSFKYNWYPQFHCEYLITIILCISEPMLQKLLLVSHDTFEEKLTLCVLWTNSFHNFAAQTGKDLFIKIAATVLLVLLAMN